ncbi:MarR family transcriptional regulator [Rathayibacter sp. YIM 133350]|uniref:MarR family winged helix-turn-helix transcriptional regulator n=1 Tax=Rathayibacter sp. YIM 133350 TaxID=3131992 RepID=UPI00307F5248
MVEETSESAREARVRAAMVEITSAANRLTRVAARMAGSVESPALWRTLSVLTTTGSLRLGTLAAESRVSQPTMTNLVHTLEEYGWVERVADADDARVSLIGVTDAGSHALEDWRQRLGAAMFPLFADVDDDDLNALTRSARLILDRIAAELTSPE